MMTALDTTGLDPNGAAGAAPASMDGGGMDAGSAGMPMASPATSATPAMSTPSMPAGGTAPMANPTVTASVLRYANWCLTMRMRPHSLDTLDRYAAKRSDREYAVLADAIASRRKTAAPDYLQKADEALTNLLNQKAEEFQESVQALQQALMTVQQAEQVQQQANPLNVLPPAGSVQVMPGGGAPGGGDPSQAQGDPNQAAALLPGGGAAQPGQQMQARRRQQAGQHDFSDQHYRDLDEFKKEYGDPGEVRVKHPPKLLRDWDGPRGAMEEDLGPSPVEPGRHRASRGRRPLGR